MRALFPLLFLFGCQPEEPDTLTWYGDMEPLVQRVCASCHVEGGVGAGDFTTYEGFRPYAEISALYVQEGLMPPPASEPECRPYIGAEHLSLTPEERQDLLQWIDEGSPEGDPARSVGDFVSDIGRLDDADLVLELPAPHTVTTDEKGNQYRCFVVDHVPEQDIWVTAFDVQVDNPEVVHHMLLFADPEGRGGAAYGADEGATSFDCADPIMDPTWEPLHAWAPGMPPTALSDGHGLKIEAGTPLIIQMHYFVDDDLEHEDRSAYALRTTTDTVIDIQLIPGAFTDLFIPAGEPEHVHTGSEPFNMDFSVAIHGVFPHMHLLGTRYEFQVDHADGSSTCVVRGDWDFDHQMVYMFEEPVVLESGATLVGSCTYDNSADNPNQLHDPPIDVTWGEGTDDEMCVFLSYVSISL